MKSNETTGYKAILGIGNALVDVLINLDEEILLEQFGLPKGSMTLVDAQLSERIQNSASHLPRELQTGGSAANTIHGVANLGGECGYLGKISNDEMGDYFKSEFERKNIRTHLMYSSTPTGKATALITPDSERTFGTYLGAAMELEVMELSEDIFRDYKYVYVEGYLVQNHQLIETIFRTAKTLGLKTAIDLSSYNIVEANLSFLKNIIGEYVDIVFANEEEARAFTGLDPEKAIHEIAKTCEIAIVKIGAQGSLIKTGDKQYRIDAIKANSIDSTGAGDIYASGFLYALAEGHSLEKAGKLGSFLSGKVVEVMGAKLPENEWMKLKPQYLKILQE